jgi:hypothetical protein
MKRAPAVINLGGSPWFTRSRAWLIVAASMALLLLWGA